MAGIESTPLEELFARILSPDNVLRRAAEGELERRSGAVPGFCVGLANYYAGIANNSRQCSLSQVAASVLKRSLSRSANCEEVQHVVTLFVTSLSDLAITRDMTVFELRQWIDVVRVGVLRLATLRGGGGAVAEEAAAPSESSNVVAAAATCFDAVTHLIISQLLHAAAQAAQADVAVLRIVYGHLYLLQTFFDVPMQGVLQEWRAELVASCTAPLLEMLTALASMNLPSTTTAMSGLSCMRCSLQSATAQTLCLMFEWQFTVSQRAKFPAELKQGFIAALPSLQSFFLVPCVQWASLLSKGAVDLAHLPDALARVVPWLAASAVTLEFVTKVLQYGGWFKRCATPELLRGLLSSLDADIASYRVTLNVMEDEDAMAGGVGGDVGPSGTRADGWVPIGREEGPPGVMAEAAVVLRHHATQRWTLFRDVALLPFLQRSLIDIVGDQCGRRYYEVLLAYAALSPAEACAWEECPNTFLREEAEREDGIRGTTREVVAQLYTDSIPVLGPLFLQATLEDLNERLFTDGDGASQRQDVSCGTSNSRREGFARVLHREATLFFMEVVLQRCAKKLRECGAADFSPLASHIWDSDVTGPNTHPVTSARALMLLTAVVKFSCDAAHRGNRTAADAAAASAAAARAATPATTPLDAFIAKVIAASAAVLASYAVDANASSRAFESASGSRLTAVVVCRFLHSTQSYWPPAVLEQHFASLQDSLLMLFSPQVDLTEEVLYDAVDLLTDLLHAAQRAVRPHRQGGDAGYTTNNTNASANAVAIVSERLPAVVMGCWRCHVSDPSFADVVLRLLRRVVRDGNGPAQAQLLHELSWINNVLAGYADSMAEVCAVPYFLRLLRSVFAHAEDEVANAAALLVLDSLCQLLLCTEESAILVASSSCLAALLRRCPAAQSVQVHVVAASMEAALGGSCMGRSSSTASDPHTDHNTALIAHAPRTVYPFSSVVVAIVLRTLQDARGEASLLEMGQTLVTIMRQSASFTEPDLLRVIHATVHRLAVVRTDTVTQQLLAPLATLLVLHPVALLRTLVQGGLLAETMGHWLPRVEHFTDLSVTYASCEGLLGLLRLLSDPAQASMTPEEGQQVAQMAVACRWKLPEDVVGNTATAAASKGGKSATMAAAKKKGGKAKTHRSALASALGEGTAVQTSLPLYAAVLVAVGRGLLALLSAPPAALRKASQPDGADVAGDIDAESTSSDAAEDDGNGRRLFQESSSENDDDWDDELDDFEGEEDCEGGLADDAAVAAAASCKAEPPFPPVSNAVELGGEAAGGERVVAAMGAQLLPWMEKYGNEVSPYFTVEETQQLMAFFASAGKAM